MEKTENNELYAIAEVRKEAVAPKESVGVAVEKTTVGLESHATYDLADAKERAARLARTNPTKTYTLLKLTGVTVQSAVNWTE